MGSRSGGHAGRPAKRALDILFAACGLVAAAPVMALVALAIRVSMGSPVLFRQERPGLHGRPFVMLKFRSMTVNEGPEHLPDLERDRAVKEMRVTRLGYWLRRTSLDELPELWNVLRGDMSVVGPRPLLMEYLPHYTPQQMRRHEMRPGITGLAQVRGRHALDWDARFALDRLYVDRWSLRLDARILRETLSVVLAGQGSFSGDEPPRFDVVAAGGKPAGEEAGGEDVGSGTARWPAA